MICRIWHGWATEANADAYERLLRSEIFVGILRREIPGFQAIDLLRRSVPGGAEFVTLMWFDSIEAVQSFAGPDYEAAVVPPEARQLLMRFDSRSAHYTVTERRSAS
ncbi:MAG: antibiotic biosynthesis monooxygenase [Nitrospirae bacterium]|nr:antibiotic biosynthesis monooxygenase [Nitrospirota bacterium]